MSRKMETLFQKEVRQRRFNRTKRRLTVLILGLMTIGVIYCLHQGMLIALGGLCIVGLLLITFLVPKWYQHRSLRDNFLGRSLPRSPLKRWPRKHVFGIVLLVSVIVLQANPSVIMTPLNNGVTRLLYNPQPPQTESPWPWEGYSHLHPAIINMPPEAETSIASVADYLLQQEDDPWLRVKAIHDYVISHLSYDIAVVENVGTPGSRSSQDAQTVFRTQKGVCEGYARLFKALAKKMDMEVKYVTGNVRRDFAPTDIIPTHLRFVTSDYDWTGHAWNVVKIEEQWYLVDTTWDDGGNPNDYLLVPPEVMIISHHPDLSSWQLLAQPINRTSFEAQPVLDPQFFQEGLELISPRQYETKVGETANIKLQVPGNFQKNLIGDFIPLQKQKISFSDLLGLPEEDQPLMQRCQTQPSPGKSVQLTCQFPNPGNYQVFMFLVDTMSDDSDETSMNIQGIGQLKFTSTHTNQKTGFL